MPIPTSYEKGSKRAVSSAYLFLTLPRNVSAAHTVSYNRQRLCKKIEVQQADQRISWPPYLVKGEKLAMAITQNSVAVGVFSDLDQAKRALEALRMAGFGENETGFLSRALAAETTNDVAADAASGAVRGGVVGGVLGAAAALLIPGFGPAIAGGILVATLGGVAIGAAAGGVVNALMNMGIVENDARSYQRELEAGHTIVTVKTSTALEEAAQILREQGATNVKVHEGAYTTSTTHRSFSRPLDNDDTSGSAEIR
jgi:uncharacterized membrane protein